MLLGFLFYRFFNVNMNSVLNFYNFSMKNFCKYINFYSRPWRMIVSKLAKELYTNWGNKSYPYCFIYFHLFLFFTKQIVFWKIWTYFIFFKIFHWRIFVKKTWNFILDHNALISVFRFLICYHNYFYNLLWNQFRRFLP